MRTVDTKTVHDIDIDDTTFKVRAFKPFQRMNWDNFMQKCISPAMLAITPQLNDEQATALLKRMNTWISDDDWNRLIEMMDSVVVEIESVEDKRATLESMEIDAVLVLGAKIRDLSSLDEGTGKNSNGSSS